VAPVGHLVISRQIVRTGVKPHLGWEITFPTEVDDLIRFDAMNSITATQAVTISVRVIGDGSTTVKSNNGHGNNVDGVDVSNPGRGKGGPNGEIDMSGVIDDEQKLNGNGKVSQEYIDANLSIRSGDSATWQQIYDGSTEDLDPGTVYYHGELAVGQTIDFAARGGTSNGTGDRTVTTEVPSSQLIVLKNGDPLPTNVSSFSTGEIQSYLSSYVDTNNNVVLGPHELIYLFDLDSQPGAKNYDLQDLGVHVLLTPVTN
jgi:hypothetical protein